MEINNNKSIVKRLRACSTCADTVTGVPTGQIRTVDSSHFETRFNKLDPIYNTTEDCPVCKGSKYFFG